MDTLGTAKVYVLISEVFTFQEWFCTHLYLAGTHISVPIKEVSILQECPHRGVPL